MIKHSTASAVALAATVLCWEATTPLAQEEHQTKAVRKNWQRSIGQFSAELRSLVAESSIPAEKELKDRLDRRDGTLEVITDGYGGVVDFNAAKGTVQYEATERFADGGSGPIIDWEFDLARDVKAFGDGSMVLIPKLTDPVQGERKPDEVPILQITVTKSDAGPFRAGDRVRLESSIDDFSRFRKDFGRATGLVVVYYLEQAPNPVFLLKLGEAKINRIEHPDGANQPAAALDSESKGSLNSKSEPEASAR